jgi:hypothetical protein
MKRLRFLLVIICTTAFLIMVMLISPGVAKKEKIRWVSFSELEEIWEAYIEKYGGTIYILVDDDSQWVEDKWCYLDSVWYYSERRHGQFKVISSDNKLKSDIRYIYFEPSPRPGCNDVFGADISYQYWAFPDYFVKSNQEEKMSSRDPSDPNHQANDYHDLMLKTINNWRENYGP